jgi:hypothetical protein
VSLSPPPGSSIRGRRDVFGSCILPDGSMEDRSITRAPPQAARGVIYRRPPQRFHRIVTGAGRLPRMESLVLGCQRRRGTGVAHLACVRQTRTSGMVALTEASLSGRVFSDIIGHIKRLQTLLSSSSWRPARRFTWGRDCEFD